MRSSDPKKAPALAFGRPRTDTRAQTRGLLTAAVELHKRGQVAQAKALYETILKSDPRNSHSLHFLGVIAIQAGDHERAVDLIDSAIAIEPHNATFFSNRGLALRGLNQLEAAVASFDKAIALRPDLAEGHFNRGSTLLELKEVDAALGSFNKAISFRPRYAEAHLALGKALCMLRQPRAAVDRCEEAISIRPDFAEAHYGRGTAMRELGELDAAVLSYRKAITIKPGYFEAHFSLGNALYELKQLQAAIASYDQAIALMPTYADTFFNRGNALRELGQWDAAVASYDRAIAINPHLTKAYSNRGIALCELKQLDAAIESYDKAIAIEPDCVEAHLNRGNALKESGRPDAALVSYDHAIALKPDLAEGYRNRGLLLKESGRLPAAIVSYDQALAIKPDYVEAYFNKAFAVLLAGDFENGWNLYEWRWKDPSFTSSPRNFDRPLWLGDESLSGKTILLHSEQGLGDTIQFCRYASSVAALGARVIMEVPGKLIGLLGALEGVSEFVEKGSPLPSFDYHCPMLSLPLAFRTRLETIPSPHGYLRSDSDRSAKWASRLGNKKALRVGLVWSGDPAHKNDHNRSVALADLVATLPKHMEYVSLQTEVRDADRATLELNPQIKHYGGDLESFADTAALCDLMDVIVSVDTSVAHLGGAMGKRTWILLPFDPDFRWLLERNDCPWYASVRLYRQNTPGAWQRVFERVAADLQTLG